MYILFYPYTGHFWKKVQTQVKVLYLSYLSGMLMRNGVLEWETYELEGKIIYRVKFSLLTFIQSINPTMFPPFCTETAAAHFSVNYIRLLYVPSPLGFFSSRLEATHAQVELKVPRENYVPTAYRFRNLVCLYSVKKFASMTLCNNIIHTQWER